MKLSSVRLERLPLSPRLEEALQRRAGLSCDRRYPTKRFELAHRSRQPIHVAGSVFIVRVTAARIFPNCPRYIHKMQLLEHSVHAPRADYMPPAAVWKTFDDFRDYIPARDRAEDEKD